jgi:hypothetical protein
MSSLTRCASLGFNPGVGFGGFGGGSCTATKTPGTTRSMRQFPGNYASTSYYTIRAGDRDQVLCATSSFFSNCASAALFSGYTNVKSQLDVGAGQSAGSYDWDWADGSPTNMAGGDKAGGVGHFKSKTNTGRIHLQHARHDLHRHRVRQRLRLRPVQQLAARPAASSTA